MAEELPGFIPRILQLDDVSLLRADEAVLNAMVDGWRAQMLARGLAVSTITARCSLIGRFVEFTNEYPWRWRPLDLDQFLADLRSRETPIELSTLRSYSNAISMFCSYVSDGRYGWVAFCEKQFGDVPSQICFEWNTPRHTTDDAVPTKRCMLHSQQALTTIGLTRQLAPGEHAPLPANGSELCSGTRTFNMRRIGMVAAARIARPNLAGAGLVAPGKERALPSEGGVYRGRAPDQTQLRRRYRRGDPPRGYPGELVAR
jgi:hypothetical protein